MPPPARLAVAVLLCSTVLLRSPADVSATGIARFPFQMLQTFRLRVLGQVSQRMTFWVAYGPLAGRFSVVRLHRVQSGVYEAHRRLPDQGRTIFAYLAGTGVMSTQAGPAPGNPVVTIRRIGPIGMRHLRLPTVYWQTPAG